MCEKSNKFQIGDVVISKWADIEYTVINVHCDGFIDIGRGWSVDFHKQNPHQFILKQGVTNMFELNKDYVNANGDKVTIMFIDGEYFYGKKQNARVAIAYRKDGSSVEYPNCPLENLAGPWKPKTKRWINIYRKNLSYFEIEYGGVFFNSKENAEKCAKNKPKHLVTIEVEIDQ